ncbi:unnamed protein product [Gongylonema pulchrum]|uniref:Mitochondrial carrier n=1 Tax=Gongylonema pulchrum TaxID=637853 RepID=A0A183DWR6_9BILA|nr:unnamed protein product [Gongylonema pulchrum]
MRKSYSEQINISLNEFISFFLFQFSLVAKTLIAHPCTVLRRQCQVHQFARTLHLTPFTLIPVVCKVVSNEGFLTLWKGAIGSGVLWGLSTAGEILIADLFGLPRSTAISMTPFIVSSFVETVRSESGLGEELRVMDVVTNGINRLRFDFIGPKDNSKRFSLVYLSVPTACLFTSHYVVTNAIYDWIYSLFKRYVDRKPAHEKTIYYRYFPEIFSTFTSHMLADLALYPFETVLHRLYIQGTRTLIDNLDNGVTAISITAKYAGFFDCFRTIIRREGFWALYAAKWEGKGVEERARIHQLISMIEALHQSGDYAGSPEALYALVEGCADGRPSESIKALIDYRVAVRYFYVIRNFPLL